MGENVSVSGKWRSAGFGWQSEGVMQKIGIFTTSGMGRGCALWTRNGEAVESRKIVLIIYVTKASDSLDVIC